MLLLRLLSAFFLLLHCVQAAAPVAEAVKWLSLPRNTDRTVSVQVAATLLEAHRARYRIALEALAQPYDRDLFVSHNSQKLYDKVRIHINNLLAAKAKAGQDTDALIAAIHAGIRESERVILTTPIRELVYAPLPWGLRSYKMQLADLWRKYSVTAAIRDWRANKLLSKTSPKLRTLLEADVERQKHAYSQNTRLAADIE